MSSCRRWLVIVLALVVLVLAGINLTRHNDAALLQQAENIQPAYQSEQSSTLVYDLQGALSYQLQAQRVAYYSDSETTWFRQPVMTVYDADKQPGWTVHANQARLTKDKQLYLHGDVKVTALAPEAQLRQITTDNVRVDLLTQDIESNERVTLSGPGLLSTGLKMRGNLRDKTARLIEQVKTSYETQNEK